MQRERERDSIIDLMDKQLVLVEERKKRKSDNGSLDSKEKSEMCIWEEMNILSRDSKDINGYKSREMGNRSIVQECVINFLKSMREELTDIDRQELSLFLKELDEITGNMKGIVDRESAVEKC